MHVYLLSEWTLRKRGVLPAIAGLVAEGDLVAVSWSSLWVLDTKLILTKVKIGACKKVPAKGGFRKRVIQETNVCGRGGGGAGGVRVFNLGAVLVMFHHRDKALLFLPLPQIPNHLPDHLGIGLFKSISEPGSKPERPTVSQEQTANYTPTLHKHSNKSPSRCWLVFPSTCHRRQGGGLEWSRKSSQQWWGNSQGWRERCPLLTAAHSSEHRALLPMPRPLCRVLRALGAVRASVDTHWTLTQLWGHVADAGGGMAFR